MDDIVIFSQNWEEHVIYVRRVLEKLRDAGLQADITKYEFFVTKIKFLGLIVSVNRIRMNPEKIRTILKWEISQNVKDVRLFTEFCNFYRRFIRHYFRILRLFTDLTKKDLLFEWITDC
jgi:hypothetical protein